jgi:hypothetical protein
MFVCVYSGATVQQEMRGGQLRAKIQMKNEVRYYLPPPLKAIQGTRDCAKTLTTHTTRIQQKDVRMFGPTERHGARFFQKTNLPWPPVYFFVEKNGPDRRVAGGALTIHRNKITHNALSRSPRGGLRCTVCRCTFLAHPSSASQIVYRLGSAHGNASNAVGTETCRQTRHAIRTLS